MSPLRQAMTAIWWYVFTLTQCTDCAERAAKGKSWHRHECWAQHREHVYDWPQLERAS